MPYRAILNGTGRTDGLTDGGTEGRTDNKTLLDFPTPLHLLVLGGTNQFYTISVTDLIPVPCCLRRVFAFAMFDMLVCKLSGWAITRLPVDSMEHRQFEF